MKAIVNLLIVGAQLAISCRGMDFRGVDFWNEDIQSVYANWSGEDNSRLQQLTASALPRHLEPAESSRQGDRLVFDKDAFATPRNRQIVDPNVQSRLKLIEETIDKYSTPTLLVPVEDLEDFFAAFRSGGANSARTPSQVAIEELSQFLSPESARIWKNFYQTNLGINFTEGKKWFESLLHNAKSCPSELVDEVAERLVRFLLSYVFYVDMIITTIQKPTHVVI
ncbi:hypothetical protein PCASD_13977 [Puccinia coronata f. sp. avenae]|uniref:Uncharacterized protein n=1 Tax=Puccinia coronata f. sp. avenae TaxID=200324 RepID=A0A2N5UCH3_9BASI|nr:hypothetical protein PCASD_13977 [Puccinia coronata f. sp. avenae]